MSQVVLVAAVTVVVVTVGTAKRLTPNPSINTDCRDKAAPAGYVKR
jgi:hypothetical protein